MIGNFRVLLENSNLSILVISLYSLLLVVISKYILNDVIALGIPLMIYIILTVFFVIQSLLENFIKLDYLSKFFTILLIIAFLDVSAILLTLIVLFIKYYALDENLILGLVWAFVYFFTYYILSKRLELNLLLKSEVESEGGFTYILLPIWGFFLAIGTFLTGSLTYFQNFTPKSFGPPIIFIVASLPFILITNEIFWIPKTGVANIKKKKIHFEKEEITAPLDVTHAYDAGKITHDKYYTLLFEMKEKMYYATRFEKIYLINHIIMTSKNLGMEGKRGKILVMYIFPSLLNRWRIYALLPKHLQRLSHDFLEMLILIGESNREWNAIITHEYRTRYVAKKRFAVFKGSYVPKFLGISGWSLVWMNKIYKGNIGFKIARNAYLAQKADLESIHLKLRLTSWERDLEKATIKVMKTFYGVGSRLPWGNSVERGSYNEHEYVTKGNMISDFHPSIRIPASKQVIPPITSDKSQDKPEDLDYVREYLETGKLPVKRLKIDIEESKRSIDWRSIFMKSIDVIILILLLITLSLTLMKLKYDFIKIVAVLVILIYSFYLKPPYRHLIQNDSPYFISKNSYAFASNHSSLHLFTLLAIIAILFL